MAEASSNRIFKAEHFQQIQYTFVFMNATTGKEFRDIEVCQIEEMGVDWANLLVPINSCQQEHRLLVHIIEKHLVKDLPKKQLVTSAVPGAISIFGLVSSIEPFEPKTNRIFFKFTQFKEDEWSNFMNLWKGVQANSKQLMTKIKGNE